MLKRENETRFSYTFLPDFNSLNLVRVVVETDTPEVIPELNTAFSAYIVKIGALAYTGRPQKELDRVAGHIMNRTAITSISVEA